MLSRKFIPFGEPPWYMRDEKFTIRRKDFVPAYIKTREEGAWKIKEKVERAIESLKRCRVCPRNCDIDRNIKKGVCKVGRYAVVSSAFPHFGEEDCLRGWNGSGTIFLPFVICDAYSAKTLIYPGKEKIVLRSPQKSSQR